jgi:hypothetical protein
MAKYYPNQSRYRVGSVVCDRRGYVKVKVDEKGNRKWKPESHLVAELKDLPRPDPRNQGKPIQKNERVFHIGVNKQDNRPENLVVIEIRLTKYALLPSSRCLYIPTGEDRTIEEALSYRGLR